MKKKFTLLLIIVILSLTACVKKENDESYDLNGKDIINYSYNHQDYALADITEEGSETYVVGFFYKKDGKYLLIHKLESSSPFFSKENSFYKFYDNKLYGVGIGSTPLIFEIELKGENSKIKELKYELNGKTNPFITLIISEVTDKNIILGANIFIDEHTEYREITCLKENKKCFYK